MVNNLAKIVQTMYSMYGIDISHYDDTFLVRATEKRCAAHQIIDLSTYSSFLIDNKSEALILGSELNINYTEFFRNSLTYAHLEKWILPCLVEGKSLNGEIRVWSAGSSSGQEAYSIAMLLEKLIEKKQSALRYRIIATDINDSALAAAKKGEYKEDAIQNIRIKELKEFFVKTGETYTICERLKKHIIFSTYDLLDTFTAYPQDSIFGNFDLVFCCNVLFYYKSDFQIRILKKLINSMSERGYLITGEAERQTVAKLDSLKLVAPPSPIFQKSI